MAVQRITTIEHFIGLSTDTKPTGVHIGSEFFEYDSGQVWYCYDGSNYARNGESKWKMEHTLEDM
jgi:hypothetical protein